MIKNEVRKKMENLFKWIVDQFIVWIIALVTTIVFIKSISDSKTGQALWSVVIGGATVYFVQNPITVLEWFGKGFSKMFGG